jgi:hypothetical protein
VLQDSSTQAHVFDHRAVGGLLFAGHVTDMAGAKGVWNIAAMAEQYGPLFKLQLLTSVVVVLSDPQTISRVARKTGEACPCFCVCDSAGW